MHSLAAYAIAIHDAESMAHLSLQPFLHLQHMFGFEKIAKHNER